MTQRITGPLTFAFVAGLVFVGLGWVTVAALRVEHERRDSAAEVELGHNLRIALWRLDGRMLSPLSVEDSRPYQHYAGGDIPTVYGPGSAPLLDAPLPDWMLLHFQVDPEHDWSSPQVMEPALAALCRQLWPGLTLRNVNSDKATLLKRMKVRFPARQVSEGFASRERALPEDATGPSRHSGYDPALAQPTRTAAHDLPPGTTRSNNSDTDSLQTGRNTKARADANSAVPEYKVPWERFEKGTQQSIPQREPRLQLNDTRANNFPMPDANRFSTNLGFNELTNEYQKRVDIGRAAVSDAKSASQNPLMQNSVLGSSNFTYISPGSTNGLMPWNTLASGNTVLTPSNVRDRNDQHEETQQAGGAHDVIRNASPALSANNFYQNWFGRRDAPELQQSRVAKKRRGNAPPCPAGAPIHSGVHLFSLRLFEDHAASSRDASRVTEGAAEPERITPPLEQPGTNPSPQNLFFTNMAEPLSVHLGSMRPQWITAADGTDVLVFVRTARLDHRTVYQGVVVDWGRLEASLRQDVSDLFPEARLLPVKDTTAALPERTMTALPVQLDPGPTPLPPALSWTPLRLGLVLAWVATIIALAAVGYSRWSILDLAERRIRFVSAVTHELRTPLTSLRLYLDLLLSGMVQEETRRREYLATLNTESERLHRLIDNVLDYARLEKRRKASSNESLRVSDLLEQISQTWAERCEADEKELVVINTLPPGEKLRTDPHLVQQIVGNLIDNARKYARDAADKRIWLWARPGSRNRIVLEVEDRGVGVPTNQRRLVFQPFRRGESADTKAGGAGLGLALAKQWAELLGGRLSYRPADGGTGACFKLELRTT